MTRLTARSNMIENQVSALHQDLRDVLGARVSVAEGVRAEHASGFSYHAPPPPDLVVFPQTTQEVSEVVQCCARHRAPIIPFGAGTSVEGQIGAVAGGVCLDMRRMDQVLAIHEEDLDAVVQAGVTQEQLKAALAETRLFFPVGPGANATFGGMAATRASGTNAVRYGTMRENVLALTVVLPDGRIIKTGSRARKSSAGYDLTRLFIGSEGTLGVITEVAVRLYGRPEAMSAAVCPFPELQAAVTTVIQTIQAGIPVARIELLDEVMMDAVNRYSGLAHPVQPTLFLEFHGSAAGVAEQAEQVQAIAQQQEASAFEWTTDPAAREVLWQARHNAAYAALALRPEARPLNTDVCVPISRLAECILTTKQEVEASGLVAPLVGHVGDGNFHLVILVNPDNPEEMAAAQQLNERLVRRALEMEGTSTGEHGVGLGKLGYMALEHGEALTVMQALKQALDPQNLMNPGKTIPL